MVNEAQCLIHILDKEIQLVKEGGGELGNCL